MAARRSKPMPPYEVMGGALPGGTGRVEPGQRASGWPPTDPDGETVDMLPEETGAGGSYLGWRSRTSPPILIRVPRANAVILLFLFAGIIVLAYWIGNFRGRQEGVKEGVERKTREYEAQTDMARRFREGGGAVPEVEVFNPPDNNDLQARAPREPRQDGLNYYVVARFPRDEAVLAAKFLQKHGVASFVRHEQNTAFYEVIALRGFESIDATAKAFKAELDRLGRLWKQDDKGPDDFDPYPRKYVKSR